MNGQRLLDVGLAVALVVAFGLGAAAMDDAMTTDPDSVIDIDSRLLPVGSDAVGELKQEVLTPGEPKPRAPSEEDDPSDTQSQAQAQQQRESGGGGGAASESDSGRGSGPTADWLWSLLELLFLVLLALLGAIVAVVMGVYVGRNRDRLADLLTALLARLGLVREDDTDTATETRDPDFPNDVAQAWYEMVCCLGLESDRTKTPEECAAAAVDAGHDPAVVALVTDAFQSVRYGNQPVTDDLCTRVRAAVAAVDRRQRLRDGSPEGTQ